MFLFCQICAISQDEKPNLSGVWRRSPEKSSQEGMRVKIEQNGSDIIIIIFRTQNEENTCRIHIGSDDNKNQIHGAPMLSKAAWDGTALVVHSVAKFGSDELRMDDRWALSDDKQTLTFTERHHFGAEPQPTEDTFVFNRQPDASWEPPQPPQSAEQVYKNIQVMKGVPAPRLMGVMTLFTKSLGVECNYCHVPNEFEKDDKPAKNTARKMLNMVHQINDANFPDHRVVSCGMCHRGSPKPEAFPK
jgi:photosynthetic reaction center cytochrome c subunit